MAHVPCLNSSPSYFRSIETQSSIQIGDCSRADRLRIPSLDPLVLTEILGSRTTERGFQCGSMGNICLLKQKVISNKCMIVGRYFVE